MHRLSDKRKQLPAFPLLGWIRRSSCLLPLSDERSVKVSLYSALARLFLFRRQSFWLLLQIELKVVDSFFLSVRPVPLGISGYPTFTLISLFCFDTPVISQHVFTSGHKSLSCALHTGICFLSHPLPSVSLLDLAILLPRGNTCGLPSSKLGIIVETLGATSRPETYASIRLNVGSAI